MRIGTIALLVGVSSFDSIIMYYLLINTFLIKEELDFLKKMCIATAGIIVTIALTLNRIVTYFSSTMFLAVVLVYCLTFFIVIKDKRFFICCYIWLYYSILSLMDLVTSFIAMQIFKQKFEDEILMSGQLSVEVVMFAITRFFMSLIVWYIVKQKWSIDEGFQSGLMIIDIVLGILVQQYQKSMVEMALGERTMNAIDQGFSLLIVLIMVMLCMILVNRNKLVLKERNMLEMHDQMMIDNYQMLQNNVEKNKQFIHDMKHHLILIEELVQEKDLEGLADYVHEIKGNYWEIERVIWTGNQFLDFVLNQKKKKAKDAEIEFVIETEVIPNWCLTTAEIVVLFGNLLDNAIEACEKQQEDARIIKIEFKKRASLQFIKIQNSISEKPKIKKNRLVSTKKNPEMHGYGIKGVEQIVAKYDGEFTWNVSKDMFCVNVIFFNEGDEENE